jgi:hypothetical protein
MRRFAPKGFRAKRRALCGQLLENKMISVKKFALAFVSWLAFSPAAMATSAFDGSWHLAFITQRGACDPSYDFAVNISNGVVSHPNLLKFKGRVARSGSVHASVSVGEKYASGSGRLTGWLGRGVWSGRSGNARCAGYWIAQKY